MLDRIPKLGAFAWLAATLLGSACDSPKSLVAKLPNLDELPGVQIGAVPANKKARANVIPTVEPIELLEITIQNERSLSRLASALGATVDDLMIDNNLEQTTIRTDMVLKVRTRRRQLRRYEQRRERRAQARAARLKKKKKKN